MLVRWFDGWLRLLPSTNSFIVLNTNEAKCEYTLGFDCYGRTIMVELEIANGREREMADAEEWEEGGQVVTRKCLMPDALTIPPKPYTHTSFSYANTYQILTHTAHTISVS